MFLLNTGGGGSLAELLPADNRALTLLVCRHRSLIPGLVVIKRIVSDPIVRLGTKWCVCLID